MFQRVILESWHQYVPYICFALVSGVFIAILIRAILMKPAEVNRLSSLPLLSDEDLRQAREISSSDTAPR